MGNHAASNKIAFFEPWSLGDAVIATNIAREIDGNVVVFANSKYRLLLTTLLGTNSRVQIKDIDLGYTSRGQGAYFLRDLIQAREINEPFDEVLSIRGDFRDVLVVAKIFRTLHIRCVGWSGFFLRRIAFLDRLFVLMGGKPLNRYDAWRDITSHLPRVKVTSNEATRLPSSNKILVHVGAQWRSKAFPMVSELARRLLTLGYKVVIGYGPGDIEPSDLPPEAQKIFLDDANTVPEFKNADLIVSNDSSPMHIAGFIGARNLVLCNVGNIFEWLPQGAHYLAADDMPEGYLPKANYMSDQTVDGWPSVDAVVNMIETLRRP